MSSSNKFSGSEAGQRNAFMQCLLEDLQALEQMLNEGLLESGVRRVGIEQELCTIDYAARPAMLALPLLEALGDDHYTTELAQFNLELNVDPVTLRDDCFTQLEGALVRYLTRANRAAHRLSGRIILTGILPTIRTTDLVAANMTPRARYQALNDALLESRGRDFSIYIQGADELITTAHTVLFEGCNTSFQVHLQIDPEDFADTYNWAQLISAPVLAAATNAPLFLGKRLWRETRLALFHQSTDPRKAGNLLRQERPRVVFGDDWQHGSVLDFYRDTVTHWKVLLTPALERSSLEVLAAGGTPKLQALGLLNGTVYRWNRPCYGITDGRPHLRIEFRCLPAGPSIVDEIANAAFWIGLMNGRSEQHRDIARRMDFDEARSNLLKAARHGLDAQFAWLDGRTLAPRTLLLEELLPAARVGLARAGVAADDIARYLDIVEARVESGRTGSQWILDAHASLRGRTSPVRALDVITEGIYRRQRAGLPVHRWSGLDAAEVGGQPQRYERVEELMSTDLITVREDDLVELIKSLMCWSRIHHVPVENHAGEVVGVVTAETLLTRSTEPVSAPLLARDVMDCEPAVVSPEAGAHEALALLRAGERDCLLVVSAGKLVGIVTERDYLKLAASVLEPERGGAPAGAGQAH